MLRLSDFDFDLPEELIATRPAVPRSAARLLVARGGEEIVDSCVKDLVQWLRPGDRLVINNTRVIPARLRGERHREGGGGARIEVTLLAPTASGHWEALVKPLRKLREGEEITFAPGFSARYEGRREAHALLRFSLDGDGFDTALARYGEMPLPPYIAAKRAADAQDHEDYQTVFARHSGAVAAPTASLHFDDALLSALEAHGVARSEVTLHVGAGTFLPVKTDDITNHKMHSEWGEVSAQAAQEIAATRQAGGRVIAVGTTALRLIETAARGGEITPWCGDTDIFIYPGFTFHTTDGLITNFHLPKSTLLMLVSAFMGAHTGMERVKAIYAHALRERYRFFSYGDASLLLPGAAS